MLIWVFDLVLMRLPIKYLLIMNFFQNHLKRQSTLQYQQLVLLFIPSDPFILHPCTIPRKFTLGICPARPRPIGPRTKSGLSCSRCDKRQSGPKSDVRHPSYLKTRTSSNPSAGSLFSISLNYLRNLCNSWIKILSTNGTNKSYFSQPLAIS